MDPDLAAQAAVRQASDMEEMSERVDVDALLMHLSKEYPDYLECFFVTRGPQPSPSPSSGHDRIAASRDRVKKQMAEMCAGLTAAASDAHAHTKTRTTQPSSSSPKTSAGPSAQPEQPAAEASEPSRSKVAPGPSAQSAAPPKGSEDISVDAEMTDDFVPVTSRSQKRKLKATKTQQDPPKKVIITEKTSSRSKKPDNKAEPTMESGDSNMDEPPKERVPPLYVREKSHWERLVPLLMKQNIMFLHARSTAIGIRVQCPDSDNHRRLTALLRSESIGFHTYALKEERVVRAVIRGLPSEVSTEHIKEDLMAQGFPVQAVHRMYNRRSKSPYDMVLVIADLTPKSKEIFHISTVCRLSGLKVQPPRGRGMLSQCHRCMVYGHSARFCYAQPRCVKCLLNHGTSDCPRKQPTEEPPSCVLCGTQGHPANYRGCPKAPKEPWRRVKSAGSKSAPPPPQKFVPAPPPETNAWSRPLNRPTPTGNGPVPPAPARSGDAAPAPKPADAKRPASVPTKPSPTKETETESIVSNWQYVSYIIDNIDLDELNEFVQESKIDVLRATFKYAGLIRKVKNCRNFLNGLHTEK